VLHCVGKLDGIANQMGVKLSQLAIAWVLRQPGVSAAIVGASRPGQVEENVQASDMVLTDDVIQQIEEVLKEIDGFVPIW
jgi:aryl-alcohol dehydrogenase-like predicted oxidoreductase